MSRFPELDGFQLLSGLLAVVAGPVMLAVGFPAGWACIAIAAGIVVLVAQWAIVAEVHIDVPHPGTVALGVASFACIAIVVVYLTRAANDLPTVFPGYDHDSENFRLVPGILSLTVGAAALARAIASVHPTGGHHRHNDT